MQFLDDIKKFYIGTNEEQKEGTNEVEKEGKNKEEKEIVVIKMTGLDLGFSQKIY